MKFNKNYILRHLLSYVLATFSTVSPIFFILIGVFLLTEQSFHIIMRNIAGVDLFPEVLPFKPLSVFLGVLSIVLAVVIPIYAIKKGFAGFGWLISLIINAVFLFLFFIFLMTPLFDFLIMNIIFHKGFCTFMDRALEYKSNSAESKEYIQEFCTMASKGFNFRYP